MYLDGTRSSDDVTKTEWVHSLRQPPQRQHPPHALDQPHLNFQDAGISSPVAPPIATRERLMHGSFTPEEEELLRKVDAYRRRHRVADPNAKRDPIYDLPSSAAMDSRRHGGSGSHADKFTIKGYFKTMQREREEGGHGNTVAGAPTAGFVDGVGQRPTQNIVETYVAADSAPTSDLSAMQIHNLSGVVGDHPAPLEPRHATASPPLAYGHRSARFAVPAAAGTDVTPPVGYGAGRDKQLPSTPGTVNCPDDTFLAAAAARRSPQSEHRASSLSLRSQHTSPGAGSASPSQHAIQTPSPARSSQQRLPPLSSVKRWKRDENLANPHFYAMVEDDISAATESDNGEESVFSIGDEPEPWEDAQAHEAELVEGPEGSRERLLTREEVMKRLQRKNRKRKKEQKKEQMLAVMRRYPSYSPSRSPSATSTTTRVVLVTNEAPTEKPRDEHYYSQPPVKRDTKSRYLGTDGQGHAVHSQEWKGVSDSTATQTDENYFKWAVVEGRLQRRILTPIPPRDIDEEANAKDRLTLTHSSNWTESEARSRSKPANLSPEHVKAHDAAVGSTDGEQCRNRVYVVGAPKGDHQQEEAASGRYVDDGFDTRVSTPSDVGDERVEVINPTATRRRRTDEQPRQNLGPQQQQYSGSSPSTAAAQPSSSVSRGNDDKASQEPSRTAAEVSPSMSAPTASTIMDSTGTPSQLQQQVQQQQQDQQQQQNRNINGDFVYVSRRDLEMMMRVTATPPPQPQQHGHIQEQHPLEASSTLNTTTATNYRNNDPALLNSFQTQQRQQQHSSTGQEVFTAYPSQGVGLPPLAPNLEMHDEAAVFHHYPEHQQQYQQDMLWHGSPQQDLGGVPAHAFSSHRPAYDEQQHYHQQQEQQQHLYSQPSLSQLPSSIDSSMPKSPPFPAQHSASPSFFPHHFGGGRSSPRAGMATAISPVGTLVKPGATGVIFPHDLVRMKANLSSTDAAFVVSSFYGLRQQYVDTRNLYIAKQRKVASLHGNDSPSGVP